MWGKRPRIIFVLIDSIIGFDLTPEIDLTHTEATNNDCLGKDAGLNFNISTIGETKLLKQVTVMISVFI